MGRSTTTRRAYPVAAGVAAALVLAACGSSVSAPTTSPSGPATARTPTCPPGSTTRAPATGGTPARAGLADELVPSGPDAAVACRYAATSTSAVRSAVVARKDVAALVAELDSSQWQVITQPATYSCPMWDGSTDVLLFAYPSGPEVQVTVDLGGCGFASNGVRTVGGYEISGYVARWVGGNRASGTSG